MKVMELFLNKLYYEMKKYNKWVHKKNRVKWWRNEFNNKTGNYRLEDNQTALVKEFYGKYLKKSNIDDLFHRFYTEKTGRFELYNIPDDIYYTYVDPYFNNWDKALYLDNKCMYPRLFCGVNQADIILSRMNNIWVDSKNNIVDKNRISDILKNYDEIVVKQAVDSSGGDNVFFISGEDIDIKTFEISEKIENDIVIQTVIKQHRELDRLNSSSINTIRILSLLSKDGVKIYSAILRMGINGSRVDNACSGGITCGIDKNGRLKGVAYTAMGEKFTEHPTSGIRFDTVTIPSFDAACELVRKTHPLFADFRLISWDISIDENAEPLLVEANLCNGELDFHQLNNGPVFGEDTEKILNEVFGK